MVTRSVKLTEEQNATLEQVAASRGRSADDLIREGVDIILRHGGSVLFGQAKTTPRLSAMESELLLKINRGLPDDKAARYRELTKRRQAEDLTPDDHRELLNLSDEVERLQAERIEHLADLARLRGKPLGALMEELGVRPSSNA
jgi:hypothetical protein